ncbi:protein NLP7-like [Nicotiana sylvestris]|uniref:Protein NLP7-like isoform X1 n=1 Tax=Nicotiana sylvestris TaxID=4096 RepID=A0A1U7X9W3_NICSY|nr:PREDICTED: protein NLP7-like isoform X1 [Nicotiana sylvestris]
MPIELKFSYRKRNDGINRWVFWTQHNGDELNQVKSLFPILRDSTQPDTNGDCQLNRLTIKNLVELLDVQGTCLIQFWSPIRNNGGKTFLTTADQPFSFNGKIHEGLWAYRRVSLHTIASVDATEIDETKRICVHGRPARVFRSGMPEFSPHVRYYYMDEYPLRNFAMCLGVGSYWTLPVFESSGDRCIGVLEYAFEANVGLDLYSILDRLINNHRILKTMGLALIPSWLACPQEIQEVWEQELAQVKEALDVTCKTHMLLFAQTWIPVLDSSRTQMLITSPPTKYWSEEISSLEFLAVSDLHHVQIGQGLVGKVLSSKGSCFCRDITQLSIDFYPLVPIARCAGFTACFAIFVRLNSACHMVLEFFLPRDEMLDRNPQSFLSKLLATIREQLPSFFLDSGPSLFVEVIRTAPVDELDSFEINQPQQVVRSKGNEKVVHFDSLNQDTADLGPSSSTDIGAHYMEITNHTPDNGEETVLQDSAHKQGVEEADAMDKEKSSVHFKENKFAYTDSDILATSFVDSEQNLSTDKASLDEKLDSFKIGHRQLPSMVQYNTINQIFGFDPSSSSDLEEIVTADYGRDTQMNLQSKKRGESTQPDSAHQQTVEEADVADKRKHSVHVEENTNSQNCPEKHKRIKRIEKEYGISRSVLEEQFGKKLSDAAKSLGVARSTLKRMCRDYDIYRWPRSKSANDVCSLSENKPVKRVEKQMGNSSREDLQLPHASLSNGMDTTTTLTQRKVPIATFQSDNTMSVKVTYKDVTIRFPLSLSSGKIDLETEVEKRLKLVPVGSYSIKYEDEDNDWIAITCDSDLEYGIHTLRSLGRTTMKMLVEPLN